MDSPELCIQTVAVAVVGPRDACEAGEEVVLVLVLPMFHCKVAREEELRLTHACLCCQTKGKGTGVVGAGVYSPTVQKAWTYVGCVMHVVLL